MKNKRLLNIIFREIPIYYLSRIVSLLPNHGIVCRIRGGLICRFLGSHSPGFRMAQGGIINYPEKIRVGENVYIAHRAYINATAGLKIGNHVTIGPNCIIATENHSLADGKVMDRGTKGEITIGNGTWIGGNVTITAGVTIGSGCMIGAGSVVTRNIKDNCMAAGAPARVVKTMAERRIYNYESSICS